MAFHVSWEQPVRFADWSVLKPAGTGIINAIKRQCLKDGRIQFPCYNCKLVGRYRVYNNVVYIIHGEQPIGPHLGALYVILLNHSTHERLHGVIHIH